MELSTGSDWSIDIYDPLVNGIQSWSLITGFSKQQDTTDITSNGLDGKVRRAFLPGGWSGSITYDRANRALDDYFAAKEEAFFDGRVIPPVTITETIREPDGSVSQWRYEDVSTRLANGGNAQGREKVEQSVDWTASRRKRVI